MQDSIHFTADRWERVSKDWSAWWAGELDRPMVVIENHLPFERLNPYPPPFAGRAGHFPLDAPVDQVLDYYQMDLENTRYYGDAYPKWWPDFGPGIAAGFMGAKVNLASETIWFEPGQEERIENLSLAVDASNPWWRRMQTLTRAAVERWGDQVCIGFTDLGGNLDILASFRTTQQLLFDLYDAPDEISRLSTEITRGWLHYYDELAKLIEPPGLGTAPWAYIWSPQRTYMLQCDFSYMISPRMFERFVMPDLAACCQSLDHSFYHMDGKGQIPHLDLLLSLPELDGIQWVPGDGNPPPENWLPLLKRIRDGGKLCQINLGFEGALTVVRELGGRGFAIWIKQWDGISASDAQAFLKQLALVDISRKQP